MTRERGNPGHRSQAEKDSQRTAIARMHLRGLTQLEIANRLEIDQATVSRDLKNLRDEWKAIAIKDVALERGKLLAKLQLIQSEYWQAWENSQRIVETLTIPPDGDGERVATVRVISAGNPAFLKGLTDAIREEANIMGLYPTKDEKPVTEPLPPDEVDWAKISFDDLEAIARGDMTPLQK